MMPEIVGKWYSRKPIAGADGIVQKPMQLDDDVPADVDDEEDYSKLWCYCNAPSFGNMVKCDNTSCTIEWFHFDCLGIKGLPKGKGKWYCPSCRKLPKFNRKKIS